MLFFLILAAGHLPQDQPQGAYYPLDKQLHQEIPSTQIGI